MTTKINSESVTMILSVFVSVILILGNQTFMVRVIIHSINLAIPGMLHIVTSFSLKIINYLIIIIKNKPKMAYSRDAFTRD